MKNILKFIVVISIVFQFVNASTMYTLTKFPKIYLVVENYSSVVTNETKNEIMEELKTITQELGIDTSGYSHRSLAILIYDTPVDDMVTLNVELGIGELVKRVDDNQEVFSLTYQTKKQTTYDDKNAEEVNELVLEYVMMLMNSFSDQYKEDNKKLTSAIDGDYKTFAKDLGYETNYNTALQRAKKEKKDIMFVMVANFCPWCVKLEKQILAKRKYNDMIQKKYVPLIINREVGGFPQTFQTPLVPTVYFVDYKDESIKDKVIGFKNRFDLFRILEE
jgi:hypothetical protein